MTKVKYFYNVKTLRFERAPFPWGAWIVRCVTFLFVTGAFFTGLFYLQNRFFETERERLLRSENDALKRHKGQVETNVDQALLQLASLKTKDETIYKRIFLVDKPVNAAEEQEMKDLLNIELTSFEGTIAKLKEKAGQIHGAASLTNYRFKKLFWPKKQDIKEMQYYPTQIPVKNFTASRLACGFGEHINPFNKLLYRHKGIDIAAEKGSEVMAAGDGQVVTALIQSTPYGQGNYIEIEHEKGYRTKYAHLDGIKVVRGQKVKQGQIIGTIGTSGGAVAPHLHYEVLRNNSMVDPIYFFTEQLNEREWLGLIESNKKVKQALD